MNKKVLFGIIAVVVILLLVWAYFLMKKHKEASATSGTSAQTPAELEKKAAELRAQQAGVKYNTYMNSIAAGII